MSGIYLVYSLDPRGWMDVYPKWVCQEFSNSYQSSTDGNSGQLVLGPRFFGSTIHWEHRASDTESNTDDTERVGRASSTPTPVSRSPSKVSQTSTNGGYRSVECVLFTGQREITTEMAHTTLSANRGGGWRFRSAADETDGEFRSVSVTIPEEWVEVEETHTKIAIWQWGRVTGEQLHKKKQEGTCDWSVTLKRLPDKEWVAYDLETSTKIEQAWQQRESEIIFEVGVRQFKIIFENNWAFAKQVDVNDSSRVRVVKRNPNLTEAEILETIQEWETLNQQVVEGDACPLCYEQFCGSLPNVTLSCGHIFHCACLQPMLIGNMKNHYYGDLKHHCPMCRDEFTSEQYTEITGDELVITNAGSYYEGR